MKKNDPQKNRQPISRKRKLWFTAGAIIILIVATFGMTKAITSVPKDLGHKLTYIGTKEYGCHWWERPIYLSFCPPEQAKVYYFATEMSQQELTGYFQHAGFNEKRNSGGVGSEWRFKNLYFNFNQDPSKEFIISYYDNAQTVIDTKKLKQTGKPYVISMPEEDYNRAKEAL